MTQAEVEFATTRPTKWWHDQCQEEDDVEQAIRIHGQCRRLSARNQSLKTRRPQHESTHDRPSYVVSLETVTERDGTLYVLCFSHDGPDTGPHPIRKS